MNWIHLETTQQLQDILHINGYSILFKHSTRCPISMMAKKRFELDKDALPQDTPLYFLDLIKHRDLSAAIAQTFGVYHESPQLLLIKDGKCVYHASHGEISGEIAAALIT